MPSRNRIKTYAPESYYHIYNRGVNRQDIFNSDDDFHTYLHLFKRHLGKTPYFDKRMREYQKINDIELLAFCLMPNHIHLLVYQDEATAITLLMQRVMATYTAYFNKKYDRIGPLFQDRFKAVRIDHESYLLHISRYIHLNPLDLGKKYDQYAHSSYEYYLGTKKAEWLNPKPILGLFNNSRKDYEKFLEDYIDYRKWLPKITSELANF